LTKRHNIPELAFEDYLRFRGLPYIAVREELRPVYRGRKVKNLDFIVTSPGKENALVDIKGKRHSAGSGRKTGKWENWILAEDIEALAFWERCFGRSFTGLLVFIYEIGSPEYRADFAEVHEFAGRHYGLLAVPSRIYRENMVVRSVKWDTRSIPSKVFRSVARPVSAYL
jgi:hypothetical protein